MDGTAVKAMMAEIAPVIRDYVEASFGELAQRLEEIEKRSPPPPEKGDPGERGPPGVGVEGVSINKSGEVIVTLSDGSTRELGEAIDRERIYKDAERANELRAAEHRAFMAETRESLAEMRRSIEARLAEVKDGKDGERGEKGEQGPPGQDGEQGPAGRDGNDGADGRDGADADMEALAEEVRSYIATIPLPENGKDGEPGKDAYAGEAKGLFDPTIEYRAMDVVSFNGSEWRAKCDNPGSLPGDGWMLSASKGKRGDRGERGPDGRIGKDGNNGASPVELKFDADKMQFVMALDDGNILEADFYPVAKAIRGE